MHLSLTWSRLVLIFWFCSDHRIGVSVRVSQWPVICLFIYCLSFIFLPNWAVFRVAYIFYFFSPLSSLHAQVHVRPGLTKNETDLEVDHPLSLTALYLFSCFRYFLCRRCQCWDSRSLSRSDLPELRVRNKGWKAWWKELKN